MALREKEAGRGERVFWQKEHSRYQNKRVTLGVAVERHRAPVFLYPRWRRSRRRPTVAEAVIFDRPNISKTEMVRLVIWRHAYQLEWRCFTTGQGLGVRA